MKTLLVTLHFPPTVGGVETYYGKVAAHWPEPLKVILNRENALISPFLPFFGWLKGFWTLKAQIQLGKPDWILGGEILPTGIILYLLSFFHRCNYAIFLHGLDFSKSQKTSRKRFISKRILKKARLVICANKYTMREVQKAYPAISQIEVVNPGVDIDAILPEATTTAKTTFDIVTVGRLVKRKGVDMTLQAVAKIKPLIPELRYMIIGNGPDKEYLLDIIRELRIESVAQIVTGVSDSEKAVYLRGSDIFVMPSRNISGDYEGFGIVYLEAGLYKKAVIAGRGGGVEDAVSDNVNGILVNGEDYNEIAEAIIRLYNDETLRKRLGEEGYKRSLESSWQQRVTLIHSLLEQYGKTN